MLWKNWSLVWLCQKKLGIINCCWTGRCQRMGNSSENWWVEWGFLNCNLYAEIHYILAIIREHSLKQDLIPNQNDRKPQKKCFFSLKSAFFLYKVCFFLQKVLFLLFFSWKLPYEDWVLLSCYKTPLCTRMEPLLSVFMISDDLCALLGQTIFAEVRQNCCFEPWSQTTFLTPSLRSDCRRDIRLRSLFSQYALSPLSLESTKRKRG